VTDAPLSIPTENITEKIDRERERQREIDKACAKREE
jgi:hypothetical protein